MNFLAGKLVSHIIGIMSAITALSFGIVKLLMYFFTWEIETLNLISVIICAVIFILCIGTVFIKKENLRRKIYLAFTAVVATLSLALSVVGTFYYYDETTQFSFRYSFMNVIFISSFIPFVAYAGFIIAHIILNKKFPVGSVAAMPFVTARSSQPNSVQYSDLNEADGNPSEIAPAQTDLPDKEKTVKSGKKSAGVLAIISAFLCFLMLAFPIVAGTVYQSSNYGYGISGGSWVFKACLGFDTLIFNSTSMKMLNNWYIVLGVFNWLIATVSVILIVLSIISLLKFTDKTGRTVCFIVTVVGATAGLIYAVEGIASAAVWGGDKYTLAFIPLIFQCVLLGSLIFLNKKYPPIVTEEELNGTTFKGFYPLLNHVLLMIFVPFWSFVWIYRITGYLNCVEGEEKRDPTQKLLLCMFVPFYSVYWTYKSAQRIDKLAKTNGIASDLSTVCLIFSIFLYIVAPILMQQKINEIETDETSGGQPVKANVRKPMDIATEIKKYKELLDMGAITEEEYTAQKKKLLDD